MAFRFKEARTSRRQAVYGKSYELKYVAAGSSDDLFVRSYAMGASPATIATPQGLLYRQEVSLEPTARSIFRVTVTYGEKKQENGSFSWRASTTGGTFRIQTSRETVASYPDGAFDFKQLIGVRGKDVEGAEIVIPVLKLNVTFKHPLGVVTIPYAKHIGQITGTVNSTNFLTHEPGEVLFTGADLSDGTDSEATCSYDFLCSENATLNIGEIINIAKKGHHYLWCTYEPSVEEGKGGMKPQAVYIERLYNEIDLGMALGFGGE